jgi:hypothetical protein
LLGASCAVWRLAWRECPPPTRAPTATHAALPLTHMPMWPMNGNSAVMPGNAVHTMQNGKRERATSSG